MSLVKRGKVAAALPPMFITGAPRSGTTLTARILGRHSRVFMPGETHFFDDVYARRRELGDLKNSVSVRKVRRRLETIYGRYNENSDQERIDMLLQRPEVIEELSICGSYKEIFTSFMEIQMRFAGKARWGNNVPKDIFQIEEIVSLYPDAKIFICIRDVRDFLLSYQNKWRVAESSNAAKRLSVLYHPVLTSFLWQASVKQIARVRQFIPKANLMVIRYESLVQEPRRLVQEMCRFIGEEFEEQMLNVQETNSSFEVQPKGIYSSSVGRWRWLLSNEEAYIAQKLGGNRLEEFGYRSEDLKVNPLRVAYFCATLPYGLWRAMQANRTIRGPLLPYIVKRLSALWQLPAQG